MSAALGGDVHRVTRKGATVTCSWKVGLHGEAFPQVACANLCVVYMEALLHYSISSVLCRSGHHSDMAPLFVGTF